MRKTRVFGQLMGVQGMVIGDVTMHPDPDGDREILVVSVRPDARSGGRCAQCRRSCPGYDAGVGTRRWRTVECDTAGWAKWGCHSQTVDTRYHAHLPGVRGAAGAVPGARCAGGARAVGR